MIQFPDRSSKVDAPHLGVLSDIGFRPVFIMGEHRSGTTILYKLLGHTGGVNIVTVYHVLYGETLLANKIENREAQAREQLEALFRSWNIETRVIDEVPLNADIPEEYGMFLFRHCHRPSINDRTLPALTTFCRKVQYVTDPQRQLVLKNPWDFDKFLYIKSALPEARFVFIHRDPIAIVNSQLRTMQTNQRVGNPYIKLLIDVPGLLPWLHKSGMFQLLMGWATSPSPWSLRVGLRMLAARGEKQRRYYIDNVGQLAPNDYVSIRYEDLCESPQEVMGRILEFLQLDPAEPVNFGDWLKPRPLRLLDEVAQWEAPLRRRFRESLEYHGYPS